MKRKNKHLLFLFLLLSGCSSTQRTMHFDEKRAASILMENDISFNINTPITMIEDGLITYGNITIDTSDSLTDILEKNRYIQCDTTGFTWWRFDLLDIPISITTEWNYSTDIRSFEININEKNAFKILGVVFHTSTTKEAVCAILYSEGIKYEIMSLGDYSVFITKDYNGYLGRIVFKKDKLISIVFDVNHLVNDLTIASSG